MSIVALGAATAVVLPPAALADPCQSGKAKVRCGAHNNRPGSPGGGGGGGGGGDGSTGPGKADDCPEGGICAPPGDPGEQPIPTAAVAEMAFDEIRFPPPVIHTSPENKTFVGVRTGLWIDPAGFRRLEAKAEAGPQVVTAVAIPQNVTWNLVEGSVVCDGPGSTSGTQCGYEYKRSSHGQPGNRYRISATITWNVTWTCEGPCQPQSDTLDPMEMTSTFDLAVGEIQTGSRP
ncbi:hypothetical protein GCM10010411_42010 [Actinomadura fulvescens]|uniref:ATP/GTP-binding protein n=1 Tax=Actinomadura fulvescens TaxID=46160 RepID=A0ABP6C9A6_9ACTN